MRHEVNKKYINYLIKESQHRELTKKEKKYLNEIDLATLGIVAKYSWPFIGTMGALTSPHWLPSAAPNIVKGGLYLGKGLKLAGKGAIIGGKYAIDKLSNTVAKANTTKKIKTKKNGIKVVKDHERNSRKVFGGVRNPYTDDWGASNARIYGKKVKLYGRGLKGEVKECIHLLCAINGKTFNENVKVFAKYYTKFLNKNSSLIKEAVVNDIEPLDLFKECLYQHYLDTQETILTEVQEKFLYSMLTNNPYMEQNKKFIENYYKHGKDFLLTEGIDPINYRAIMLLNEVKKRPLRTLGKKISGLYKGQISPRLFGGQTKKINGKFSKKVTGLFPSIGKKYSTAYDSTSKYLFGPTGDSSDWGAIGKIGSLGKAAYKKGKLWQLRRTRDKKRAERKQRHDEQNALHDAIVSRQKELQDRAKYDEFLKTKSGKNPDKIRRDEQDRRLSNIRAIAQKYGVTIDQAKDLVQSGRSLDDMSRLEKRSIGSRIKKRYDDYQANREAKKRDKQTKSDPETLDTKERERLEKWYLDHPNEKKARDIIPQEDQLIKNKRYREYLSQLSKDTGLSVKELRKIQTQRKLTPEQLYGAALKYKQKQERSLRTQQPQAGGQAAQNQPNTNTVTTQPIVQQPSSASIGRPTIPGPMASPFSSPQIPPEERRWLLARYNAGERLSNEDMAKVGLWHRFKYHSDRKDNMKAGMQADTDLILQTTQAARDAQLRQSQGGGYSRQERSRNPQTIDAELTPEQRQMVAANPWLNPAALVDQNRRRITQRGEYTAPNSRMDFSRTMRQPPAGDNSSQGATDNASRSSTNDENVEDFIKRAVKPKNGVKEVQRVIGALKKYNGNNGYFLQRRQDVLTLLKQAQDTNNPNHDAALNRLNSLLGYNDTVKLQTYLNRNKSDIDTLILDSYSYSTFKQFYPNEINIAESRGVSSRNFYQMYLIECVKEVYRIK